MTSISIGVVDYGMGNLGSIVHTLKALNFRVLVTHDLDELARADVLFLPGVGAFPAAMSALTHHGLIEFLHKRAADSIPIIGICLGMQLLVSSSCEHGLTQGLDLIPGQIVEFKNSNWHIGWNTLKVIKNDGLLSQSDNQEFYFNHSYYYQGPDDYQSATTVLTEPFASVIRKGRIVGLQFHPEKSQLAGRELLKKLILGLLNA